MSQEIWKPISGFESRYEISNFGRLLSIGGKYGGRKILPLTTDQSGYITCTLRAKPLKRCVRIHTLVAEHFLTKPITSERIEVDHMDSNKTNNYFKNLQWLTKPNHTRLGVLKGEKNMKGSNHPLAKLTEAKVLKARQLRRTKFITHQKLADKFGVTRRQMTDVLNGKNWAWLK